MWKLKLEFKVFSSCFFFFFTEQVERSHLHFGSYGSVVVAAG